MQFIDVDQQLKIQKSQQLLFHEIDFGQGEILDIPSPVLVLWRCVVERFGGDN